MLSVILLAIGIIGFGLGAYWDIKTTEFPDWLPYSIIILSLGARGVFSFITGDWMILASSIFIGLAFLGIGLLMYFARQWGDGDAWLLGAMGFLLPEQLEFGVTTALPFPLAMLFNFLLVSLVYLIAYSVYLGLRHTSVNSKYLQHLKEQKIKLIAMVAFFFAFSWSFAFFMTTLPSVTNPVSMNQFVFLPFLLTFVLLFSYYAKVVEKHLFKKKVRTSELREGDVALDGRWKGLSKKDIAALRKRSKHVWIKEGVRFAPVFVITIVITVFWGDLIFLFV
ncbi:MAG: A24 family peptidase [Candidatus Aenigmatarchaeota archaeon]